MGLPQRGLGDSVASVNSLPQPHEQSWTAKLELLHADDARVTRQRGRRLTRLARTDGWQKMSSAHVPVPGAGW